MGAADEAAMRREAAGGATEAARGPAADAASGAATNRGSAPLPADAAAVRDATSDDLLTPDFLAKLDALELVSRKIFRGRMKGERRSPRKGESVEFADFRNYVPGDDLRFIDWNVAARLDRLFLKMFMEEEDLQVAIVLDASASMDFGEPSKLLQGKRVAAALAYIALRHGDRVSLHTARDHLDMGLTGLRSRKALHRVLTFLRDTRGEGATDLTTTLREFVLRHKTPGVVLVLSDFLDRRGHDAALRMLAMRRCDAICVHILSPDEVDPNVEEDLRLVDLEDGHVVEVSRSDTLLAQYKRTLQAFCEDLRDTCIRRDMLYLYTLSDQPFENLVLRTLRQAGLLR